MFELYAATCTDCDSGSKSIRRLWRTYLVGIEDHRLQSLNKNDSAHVVALNISPARASLMQNVVRLLQILVRNEVGMTSTMSIPEYIQEESDLPHR
jgi:hypothetical protein